MKNPTQEVFDAAIAARAAGTKMAAIQEQFGLSHSQLELAIMRAENPELVGVTPPSPQNVVAWRDYFQVSWGRISVLCDSPESAIRKVYKEACGELSQGLRIGKGGRWFLAEPDLYNEGLQATGTRIDAAKAKELTTRAAATAAAATQKLIKKDMPELKGVASAEGVTVRKGMTKAQLVLAIIKKRNG